MSPIDIVNELRNRINIGPCSVHQYVHLHIIGHIRPGGCAAVEDRHYKSIRCAVHARARQHRTIPCQLTVFSYLFQSLPNSDNLSFGLRSCTIPTLQLLTNNSNGFPFKSLIFFMSDVPEMVFTSTSSAFSIQRICS